MSIPMSAPTSDWGTVPFVRIAALTVALLAPSPAWAFECTAVPQCPPQNVDPNCVEPETPVLTQAWNQRCMPFYIRRNDALFTGPEREALVVNAFAKWTAELASGTDMTAVFAGYTDQGAGFDSGDPGGQRNVVLSASDPAEAQELFGDDPNFLAITLTSFSTESGEIFDADIVFNEAGSRFTDVDPSDCTPALPTAPFDVENTLVHEVGHFFGFDHVTNPDATMFQSAGRCEIVKRDLAPDDRSAITTTYPIGQPTMTCSPPMSYSLSQGNPDDFRNQCERATGDGCGCSAVSPEARSAPGLALGLLMALAMLGARPRR